jgi:hypothetical protein
MTINASLPVSSFISVTASIASPAVQGQGTQSLLILGTSTFIDVTARIAVFTSATAVNTLFGSTAAEAIAAGIWFSQNSAPLYIGRWAQTASSGQLIGAPLSATASLISTWTAITSGGLDISVNGASAELLTGLNFSSVTNLNGVASVIQGGLTGATIVYSASNNNFIVTSNTTGTTSTVGFATAPGSGTNISATLGLTSTSSGAYVANGIAAESALAAVTLFDADFGQLWYGLSVLGAADSDELAISSFLTSSTNKHFNFASTQEAGVLVAATTSDLASVLSLANVGKVAVQYNGASPYGHEHGHCRCMADRAEHYPRPIEYDAGTGFAWQELQRIYRTEQRGQHRLSRHRVEWAIHRYDHWRGRALPRDTDCHLQSALYAAHPANRSRHAADQSHD